MSLFRAIEYWGSLEEIRTLLDSGVDINAVGGTYGTPLTAAAFLTSMDTLLLLLDRGADIDAVGGEYGTALTAAAYRGRRDIVILLLGHGADINMVGGEYGTALAAAAFRGSMDTVLLLLDYRANINTVGGKYGTALAAAVFCGSMCTMLLLLDHGADIDAVGGEYGTALTAAAYRDNMPIVRLLIGRGANINTVGGKYGTALAAAAFAAAAFYGGMEIVRFLLDHGADINMVGGEYGTALGAAAFCGSMDTLELLLDRGADINTVGGEYGTVLGAAAFGQRKDIMRLLLDRGANINMVGGKYGTVLGAAAFRKSMDIMRLLLDRGANITMVGGEYGTALGAAAFGGSMDTVKLLLDCGADINAVGGEYGTALGAAAFNDNMDTVLLLLDHGADINMVSGEDGTALAAAVLRGSMDTMLLLLGHGADINTVGGKYGTALAAAAFRGSIDAVLLLLDRGANINTVGGEYGTALGAAAFGQRMDIMSLLVGRGADINRITGESGTVLGLAIYTSSVGAIALLLDQGADAMCVGGSYPTTSGVYPSALDVAHSIGGQTLLELLKTAIRKQNPNFDQVDNIISRPPFPMPYTGLYSVSYKEGALPSSLSCHEILSAKFSPDDKITSEQAEVPCQRLSEEVLSHSLSALVGLHEGSHSAQVRYQWVQGDVRYFVSCNFDFGLAYAAARIAWKHFNEYSMDSNAISIQRGRWHKHAKMMDKARLKSIEIDPSSGQEFIMSPYSIKPRRLWDLKSNRVVDFRMLQAIQPTSETIPPFWAVSHSWTSDMSTVWTAINQYQWPVPLPKGITLGYLRSELLALGAQYVWIDVICLRQQSCDDDLERLRREEWKLDVPTIGNIYRDAAKIVRYFNGIGVQFSKNGWDDSRHWLQRAWTLQEIADESNTINGGIPRDQGQVFLNSRGKVLGKVIKLRSALRPVIQLATQRDSRHGCEIYELAREMTKRHATQPLDKLSGLFYLLPTRKLPCYDDTVTSEDIWRRCFHLLSDERKAEILFDFPYRGSDEDWFPTWAQVLEWPVRDPEFDHERFQGSPVMRNISGKTSFYISDILTIPNVVLYEADDPGEYKVKINNRLFGFYLPYLLQKPINVQDQPIFTLATRVPRHTHNWVVCRVMGKQVGREIDPDLGGAEVNVLKKVGVIRTDFCSELLVGGKNGSSLLQTIGCLFV